MPILLTTPLSVGALDASDYTHAIIHRFEILPTLGRLKLEVRHGRIVGGVWQDGAVLVEGKSIRSFTLADRSSPAWQALTDYAIGDVRKNDGDKTYVCAVAGTSAASGGPTGTGQTIVDGTVTWTYIGIEAEFTTMVASLPTSGSELIYNGAARVLYQWLIDRGHYAGTIV
jgi:hypothetical protein